MGGGQRFRGVETPVQAMVHGWGHKLIVNVHYW